VVRIANARKNPDLFWALRGGGGGSFGVVTRLTLATHALPQTFGDISVKIKAKSDPAFRRLLHDFVRFYAEKLFNPHWGESVNIRRSNVLEANLVFQDLQRDEAAALWKAFLADVAAAPDISLDSSLFIEAMPAQKWWDVGYLQAYSKGSVLTDPRPGAPKSHAWWTGDSEQTGSFIHAYKSAWLPATLLRPERRARLADALFAASRSWTIGLHFNKGLAGAPTEAISAARETATNPSVLDAFALAIVSASSPPDFSGGTPRDPDASYAHETEAKAAAAIAELRKIAPHSGSYLSESAILSRTGRAHSGARITRAYRP
jgi:hypothetical protein